VCIRTGLVRNSKLRGNWRTLTAGLDRLREFYRRRAKSKEMDERAVPELARRTRILANPGLARASWIDSSTEQKDSKNRAPGPSLRYPPLRSPHRSRAARLAKLVADESRHSRGVGDYGRFAPGDKSRGNLDSARRLRQLRNLPIDLYRSIIPQRSIVDPRACESIRRESPRRKGRSAEIRRGSRKSRGLMSREIHSRAGE